jgi:hypothetical protein
MVRRGVNPLLLRQLTRGEYVVDPRVVAEAILTRMPRVRFGGGSLSGVLVSPEGPYAFAVRPHEDGRSPC